MNTATGSAGQRRGDPSDQVGSWIYRATMRHGLPALVAVWTLVAVLLSMAVTSVIVLAVWGSLGWQDFVISAAVTCIVTIPIATWIGGLMRDLNRSRAELQRIARIDALTGIANRSHFFRYAGEHLERMAGVRSPLCVLMIDVDYFKQVNDELRHVMGDAVLCAVARILQQHARDGDLVARYGGEEFVALLPETNQASAISLAEGLRRRVAESVALRELAGRELTVSIGVAETLDSVSIDPVMQAADRALYVAKAGGRNRCAFQDVAEVVSETVRRRALRDLAQPG